MWIDLLLCQSSSMSPSFLFLLRRPCYGIQTCTLEWTKCYTRFAWPVFNWLYQCSTYDWLHSQCPHKYHILRFMRTNHAGNNRTKIQTNFDLEVIEGMYIDIRQFPFHCHSQVGHCHYVGKCCKFFLWFRFNSRRPHVGITNGFDFLVTLEMRLWKSTSVSLSRRKHSTPSPLASSSV